MADRMLSQDDRLRFLVWMAAAADADKSKIGPQVRRYLIADLYAYLGDEAETDETLKKAAAGNIGVLTPTFKVAQKVLRAVADGTRVYFPAGPSRPELELDARAKGEPPRVFNAIRDLPEAVLMLALEDVRTNPRIVRVKRCKDTLGCDEPGGRLFYQKRTDQAYCSRKCAARVAVRAHEARKKRAADPDAKPTLKHRATSHITQQKKGA